MKIDRLLSIIVYLLNHDLVSARQLAERYGVSARTIQRDLEAIELAGIPIYSVQGAGGGYGILDSYKLDRQLMTMDDFYYIITALESVSATVSDGSLGSTLEKVKALLPDRSLDLFSKRSEKLSIDFSVLGGDPRSRSAFQTVRQAVEAERLLHFSYLSSRLESSERTVEPMTIAFRWRSWYLYGYCHFRESYRLFRISRIKEPEILPTRFTRRAKPLATYLEESEPSRGANAVEMVLRFAPAMRPVVEEYYQEKDRVTLPDGSLRVTVRMPEDGWAYGYILSFGHFVEVLEPPRVRQIVRETAEKIACKY